MPCATSFSPRSLTVGCFCQSELVGPFWPTSFARAVRVGTLVLSLLLSTLGLLPLMMASSNERTAPAVRARHLPLTSAPPRVTRERATAGPAADPNGSATLRQDRGA